ncbi:FAD-dependent oxidoreductase [Chelativorans sp. ZYF759]|uniref:FAD-dependent oxidoreductase n=1 Tax=Chelativorans sp. ZYF759 TaxID=2692213 RepID=UPI00145D89EC|nr:FAD-dependent oxidoreductase [Chelativorans sp. ZYF759]NMG37813.1 FAD-dependent oxidoreductase [Chelativorans sp. ZYF759]
MGFVFEGHAVESRPGDTVASALERGGHRLLRRSRADLGSEDRGYFCGMGVCHECLVEIDGRSAQRACMTAAPEGALVRRHRDAEPAALHALSSSPVGAAEVIIADLAIVGAGPAGLAAALEMEGAGLRTVIVDERSKPGGQYYKAPANEGALDAQHREGDALRAQLDHSAAVVLSGHTVWHGARTEDGFELALHGDGRAKTLRVRALILATGAYERPAMVPGWTLPGVMTIGGAQGLVRSQGVLPGKRVLVAGNGPLGLQLAAELAQSHQPPLAVLERARLATARGIPHVLSMLRHKPSLVAKGLGYRRAVTRAGAEILEGWQVTLCLGGDRLEAVEASTLDGRVSRRFEVDTLCIGEGFLPQSELARMLGCETGWNRQTGALEVERDLDGATGIPGAWVAGDGGAIGGAEVALSQGRLAGMAARGFLGGRMEGSGAPAAGHHLRRARAFQDALWKLYHAEPRQPIDQDVIVCRCESVRAGQLREAVIRGASDLGALKRMTRMGMGRCQGRYCAGAAMTLLEGSDPMAPQAPLRPVPASALMLEQPEWGGHKQAQYPVLRRSFRSIETELPDRTELLVVGAGIMGVSAALHAAELGFETLVVDRMPVNAESSGGNAGSLHLQLLSFDFGSKTGGRGEALLQTLPLQRDAIALWKELETRADTPFEIATTGGMMLAEDAAQLDFLRRKIRSEREVGIEVELIERDAIARIAPHVSERMIAAAWCPGEGKINPMVATPALARAAWAAGARFAEGVTITGIERLSEGYRIEANGRSIVARRLIMAAGGWTGKLAGMLGVDLPVHGAPLQMVVTETAPPLVPCLLAHADRHLTMKQASAGNLIIGGAWSAGVDADTGRSRILLDSLRGNLWVAGHVVPKLAGLHVLRSWAAMNVDIDGAPIVGALPGHPDCVVVAGANGYTLGPLLGRIAAETLRAGALAAELKRFSPERFQ